MKPTSDNSLSTHSLQPKAVPNPNLKWMAREVKCLGEWLDRGSRSPTEPKRHRGFAGKGRATRDLVAAAHSRRESLGSEGGLRTMDRLEGCIHYQGCIVSLPQWSALTQNALPPHLRQVLREGVGSDFFPFTAGRALTFH